MRLLKRNNKRIFFKTYTRIWKKYTPSFLYKIKQFYYICQKVPTMSGNLTWSHWYELLSIKDINKIQYYVKQCELNNLDVRSLRKKIKSMEYCSDDRIITKEYKLV